MKSTPSPQDQEIIKLLEALKSVRAEYPPELLVRRRTAFMVQLTLLEKFSVKNFHSIEHVLEDENIIEILGELKPIRAEYPSILKAKQRAAFLDQAAKRSKVGWMNALQSAIRSRFNFDPEASVIPMMSVLRKSLIIVSIIAIAFAGALIGGNREQVAKVADISPTQGGISQPVAVVLTATYETTESTCTPDSTSSLCSTYGFDTGPDQESWVSKSADSWIKIDTGETATIHMVEFDKEYLGGSTGEFTLSLIHI